MARHDGQALLEGLKPSPMPAGLPLMLCVLVGEAFDDRRWLFEPKFDGLRVLAKRDAKGGVELWSRNDKRQDFQFPEIAEAVREGVGRPAMLDGEIICLDERGVSSFRALQQRFHLTKAADVRERMARHPAYLCVFDLLYWDRYDLRDLPLERRKAILREVIKPDDKLRMVTGTIGDGRERLKEACARREDGIIGKRLDSRYIDGRSDAWVKIKCIGRQEFVIGGWTDPQRSRVGLGALLVGYYHDGGLRYAGKVGTGYTREVLLDLRQRLEAIGVKACPFEACADLPRGEHVHWVKPQLVAEIGFAEWTQNGLLRQPRFEGLRPDKPARQVKREQPRETQDARLEMQDAGIEPEPVRRQTMALEEYKKKRDFAVTAEPGPKVVRSAVARSGGGIFVVQEHHASHLHYDFRLEVGGVLKSWAVPKEPTMDPSVKRLAVEVEDHPLEYAKFQGDIPEGEYGAGHVEIWDHGTYEPAEGTDMAEALEAGKLEFVLHGEKLNGPFVLIRTRWGKRGGGKTNWLLMKMKETAARRNPESPARRLVEGNAARRGERETGWQRPAAKAGRSARRSTHKTAAPAAPVQRGTPERVEWTHPDKVWFPEVHVLKGDVLTYYERVAEWLLPYLQDRPMTLERLPDGVREGAPHFWQKHTPAQYPAWIPRVRLPAEGRGGKQREVDYVLVNNTDTLLYLVNQGTLTFHPFLSRVGSLDHPDFLLFDLDPGQASFRDVVRVARSLHDVLERRHITGYPKTSGKSGLHVLVPWEVEDGYEQTRAWAMEVAREVVTDAGEVATTQRLKTGREGKVYVDVMQNALGHHAVPPWVLRPTPEATVSMPLAWDEVTTRLDPRKFTIKTALKRLTTLVDDPMAGLVATWQAMRR